MRPGPGLPARLRRLFVDPEPPLVAIELGNSGLGVAHVEARGARLALRSAAVLPLPAGTLQIGPHGTGLADRAPLQEVLRVSLERAGALQRRRVTLVLPDGAGRLAVLPGADLFGKKPAEAVQVVRFRVRRLLPFDPETAQVAYALDRGGTHAAVALVARDVLAPFEAALAELGLQVGAVELAGWVCCAAALRAEPDSDRLIVNWDPNGLTLIVCRGGSPVLARQLSGELAAQTDEVAREVHNTDLYYRDRLGGTGFGSVSLHAPGLEFDEAAACLAQVLGLQPEPIDPWHGTAEREQPAVPRGARLALASLARWAA